MIYHQFQEAAVTNSIVLEAKSLKTFPNLFYGLYRFSLCQHSLYLTHEVLAKTIHNPTFFLIYNNKKNRKISNNKQK